MADVEDNYTSFNGDDDTPNDSAKATSLNQRLAALNSAFGFLPCLIAIAVLSIVYLISGIVVCVTNCESWFGYATIWAIFVGIMSTITCITIAFIITIGPRVGLDLSKIMVMLKKFVSIWLAVLWLFAVSVGTFFAPFVTADDANGYISVWALFFLSVYLVCHSFNLSSKTAANSATNSANNFASKLRISSDMLFAIILLLLASLVELIFSSLEYALLEGGVLSYSGLVVFPLPAYAVSVGVISLMVVPAILVVQILLESKMKMIITMILAIFLAFWWLLATLILTNSVFLSLSNGYFSTYLALMASLYLLSQCQLQQTMSQLTSGATTRATAGEAADTGGTGPQNNEAYNAHNAADDDMGEGGTDF